MEPLRPKDHAEAVALFRMQLLGSLLNRDLKRGELRSELDRLSKLHVRPPSSPRSRTYAVSTMERWYYDYRAQGLDGLRPQVRNDRGHCRELTEDKRKLLLEIRRQHPTVATTTIVRTLVADGRLDRAEVSDETVRRLFRSEGLGRRRRRDEDHSERRRWEASHAGALWHADVCHGPTLKVGERRIPVRVHALLDDCSRFIVGLRVVDNEREAQMLDLCVEAMRTYGAPGVLYLDNGATYRGEALATACARLQINLVHARPYDPQARGKMERFWRTLREGCLDVMGPIASLHDVEVRLLAFVDQHYHQAPHAGLVGRSPASAWAERKVRPIDGEDLAAALTVRENRRVRSDCTVSVGGMTWEVEAGFLARKVVTVARTLAETRAWPWVEYDDARYELHPVDPKANGRRPKKTVRPKPGVDAILFDPAGVLLDQALGRRALTSGGAS